MKTKNQKRAKTFIAAATLMAALATGAHAADVPQVHVKYGDLNLHTAAGVSVLNRRIKIAAQQVCGDAGVRDLARQAQFNACTSRAVAAALASVKSLDSQLASAK